MFGMTPYRLLALAVIELSLRDAHGGDPDARHFLEEGQALAFWSGILGIPPDTVRRAAHDRGWPERVAKAKALLAASKIKRDPPASPRLDPPADGAASGFSEAP